VRDTKLRPSGPFRAAFSSLLFCLLAPLLAQANQPSGYFSALYDTLIGAHYDAAWQIHGELQREFPDSPAPLFARATILYTAMIDFEDTTGEVEFFQCCDAVDRSCQEQERIAPKDETVWLEFLRGSALAMRAFYVGRRGQVWPALKWLTKSRSLFGHVLEESPTFYDAYLGRGAYRWGVAKHAGILGGGPFIPSRDDALADLRLAMDSSAFSRHAAASSLAWFLIEDEKYDKAESLILHELERFPNARPFLWPLISLRFKTGRFQECIALSEELVQQYEASPRNNGYDVVGLYKRMANAAEHLDDDEAVVRYCRAGLAASLTDDAFQRRKQDLEILAKWLERAEKRLEQSAKK